MKSTVVYAVELLARNVPGLDVRVLRCAVFLLRVVNLVRRHDRFARLNNLVLSALAALAALAIIVLCDASAEEDGQQKREYQCLTHGTLSFLLMPIPLRRG